MESLRLQFFQSLRNLSSQPKRRPIRRHPIYFIILFRFKAVAERTQWSSAPLNLVAKCGLNYDPISGWQMCLHTKSAAAAELAGTPVSPPRFFCATPSKTLRVSRLALSFRLSSRHHFFIEQFWQSVWLALQTQHKPPPAVLLTVAKASSFPFGQRKQSLVRSY